MSEADLCIKLEEYYTDWEIYKEVPASGGRLDMYVKKGALWIAIEVKKQLSCSLIMQALRHRGRANYTYIAIPNLKGSQPGIEICKMLGIGVIEYRTAPHVEGWSERSHPIISRKIKPYRVEERMKNAAAGVQHNTESEFKITLAVMCRQLERHGGKIKLKEMFSKDHYHYSSSKSALQAIKKYCELGSIKEFRIEDGFFVLNQPLPT